MPDNPDKKGQDRKFISQKPHEQAYQKRKAAKKREESDGSTKKASNTRSKK